jgi:two-component system sensor histidine kinase KdpD
VSPKLSGKALAGYGAAFLGIAAATGLLKLFGAHVNPTTVALSFLLVVLFVATAWGSKPAVLASLLGVICFNFFFLPPIGTFQIRNPDNWVAFFAFLITALTAGQLSARAKRRAEESESAKQEIERLYYELQDTFERSSQAKALKQSERLKSALLDAVTHDLRTPLTSIKASVTTLLAELYASERKESGALLGNEGRKELLEIINEEGDRLDRFIEGLTKLARIDAGEMHLHRQLCAIDEIITIALKRAEPRTRGHQIEVWIEDELPAVKVDEHSIAEVIYTLVDNAAKYSPEASTIRVRAIPESDDAILVSVEDEGPGIRADMRERVFEKFFRAMRDGDVGDRKSPGTGMGLAIARGIIQAHGGRIWIEDAAGQSGAKFVVALPAGDNDGNTPLQSPLQSKAHHS